MDSALSKAKIKWIQSLKLKKNRKKSNLFLVEGVKIADEVLAQNRFAIHSIFATSEWLDNHVQLPCPSYAISERELKKISDLETPNQVLMVVHFPEEKDFSVSNLQNIAQQELCLVLDNLRDPGNLGTIIRTADWFGIRYVICSMGCTDIYNHKTIQASMGSFLRVRTPYLDIESLLANNNDIPIYAALLDGENVLQKELTAHGFLIIGNESKGISPAVAQLSNHPIQIPRFGQAESLNAAMATGILCALFRRGR